LGQADELGVTTSNTNQTQCRINYAIKRTALRVLSSDEPVSKGRAGSKAKDLPLSPRWGGAMSNASGRDEAAHFVSVDLDEFHRRVQVGVMIEAEMDDTMGGTEWAQGQVQSLNAARGTFTVKFTVKNDTETGEWIEEYNWEELGKEWRFAKSEPGVEGASGGKAAPGCAKSSAHLKGVAGAEMVDLADRSLSHKASGSSEDMANASGSKTALADCMRKVRPGVVIEAEMDDSNGGTEWIQGVVQSCKKATMTFTVKFAVTNEQESGEWTEEYRFLAPPASCLHRRPAPKPPARIAMTATMHLE
jgi:hypothetical protein